MIYRCHIYGWAIYRYIFSIGRDFRQDCYMRALAGSWEEIQPPFWRRDQDTQILLIYLNSDEEGQEKDRAMIRQAVLLSLSQAQSPSCGLAHGLTSYKSGEDLPTVCVCVWIKFYWKTATPVCWLTVCGCLWAVPAELSHGGHTDLRTLKNCRECRRG